MRKKIDFPPYSEAEAMQIVEDGSILCNLYGEKITDERGLENGTTQIPAFCFRPIRKFCR